MNDADNARGVSTAAPGVIGVAHAGAAEGRRPGNVIAQAARGTSEAWVGAQRDPSPARAKSNDAHPWFRPYGAGMVVLFMTQGCARASLTLGYYITGPSALILAIL